MTSGEVGKTKIAKLWVQQNGLCPVCKTQIKDMKNLNIHHIIYRVNGGQDTNSNLVLLHPNCHRQVHSRKLKVSKLDWETGL